MAEKSTKIYYSMGEVAEMLDVSPTLVRFWEGKFDIITPHRNKKGNRMFSPEDVRNLKTIYHLVKERGMTLAGADKHLKANRKAIERDMEITERLYSIRALLLEVRQELGGDGVLVDDGAPADDIPVALPDPVPVLVPVPVPEPVPEPVPVPAADVAAPATPAIVEQTLF